MKQFLDDKTLIFYGHYVDDTSVVKPEDLNHVHNAIKNFDRKSTLSIDLTRLLPTFRY